MFHSPVPPTRIRTLQMSQGPPSVYSHVIHGSHAPHCEMHPRPCPTLIFFSGREAHWSQS
jgi:hypothetical protein